MESNAWLGLGLKVDVRDEGKVSRGVGGYG
jgi:hypothetical protein